MAGNPGFNATVGPMKVDRSAMLAEYGLSSGTLVARTSARRDEDSDLFDSPNLSDVIVDTEITSDIDGTAEIGWTSSGLNYLQFRLTSGSKTWKSSVYEMSSFNPGAYVDLSSAYFSGDSTITLTGMSIDYTGMVTRYSLLYDVNPSECRIHASLTKTGGVSEPISADISPNDSMALDLTVTTADSIFVWVTCEGDASAGGSFSSPKTQVFFEPLPDDVIAPFEGLTFMRCGGVRLYPDYYQGGSVTTWQSLYDLVLVGVDGTEDAVFGVEVDYSHERNNMFAAYPSFPYDDLSTIEVYAKDKTDPRKKTKAVTANLVTHTGTHAPSSQPLRGCVRPCVANSVYKLRRLIALYEPAFPPLRQEVCDRRRL